MRGHKKMDYKKPLSVAFKAAFVALTTVGFILTGPVVAKSPFPGGIEVAQDFCREAQDDLVPEALMDTVLLSRSSAAIIREISENCPEALALVDAATASVPAGIATGADIRMSSQGTLRLTWSDICREVEDGVLGRNISRCDPRQRQQCGDPRFPRRELS